MARQMRPLQFIRSQSLLRNSFCKAGNLTDRSEAVKNFFLKELCLWKQLSCAKNSEFNPGQFIELNECVASGST
jgi:hypothetical protein